MQSCFTRTVFLSSRLIKSSRKPYSPLQISRSITMSLNRIRGWSSYRQSSPSGFNSGSPHHQIQDESSVPSNVRSTPRQRLNLPGKAESNKSSNFRDAVIVDPSDEDGWPSLTASSSKKVTKSRHPTTSTSSELGMGQKGCAPATGSARQSNDSISANQLVSIVGSSESGRDEDERNSPEQFLSEMSQRENTSQMEQAYCCSVYSGSTVGPSKNELDGVQEHDILEHRKIGPEKGPPKEHSHYSLNRADDIPTSYKFDICWRQHQTSSIKPSSLEKNKEKRKHLEHSMNDPRPSILYPGMVLLKNFINHADQIKIVKKCRELGLQDGGFYQPGYEDGPKLRLHMMCLGKDWDPQTRSYDEIRSIDGSKPPALPAEFKQMVSEAIQASHDEMRHENETSPEKKIPFMEPDICIVNFYKESGKLGLHQDRDESRESIASGLPVVSFSIGDTAEFLYGNDRDVEKAKKVELKSGDVLIFGGKSRLIFHGVPAIKPNSAPKFLADDAKLRPGRLNLTFRKY